MKTHPGTLYILILASLSIFAEVRPNPSAHDLENEDAGTLNGFEPATSAIDSWNDVSASGGPSELFKLKNEFTPSDKEWAVDEKFEAYLLRKHRKEDSVTSKVTCDLCYAAVELVKGLIKKKKSDKFIIDAAIDFCILFKVEDKRVCDMIIKEYADEVLYLARHLSLDPWKGCGIVLSKSCHGHYYPGEKWTVRLPETPKPTPKPPTPPQPKAPTLRVLHITDLHLDFQYKEGSKVDCGEPLCCRENDKVFGLETRIGHESSSKKAGKYGHFGTCDIPSITIISLFEHLQANKEKFDYIIFTGDIPAHDVWNQSQADQLRHLNSLDQLFQTYLPTTPVYWAVGNHEAAPCNSFVIPGVDGRNMTWLYDPLAKVWGRWLPKSALGMVKSCGSYSMSPYKGFRIISVNTNYCNKNNPWILLNTTDSCGTLQWLVSELQEAEDNHEKVHLLMHAPPGEKVCLKYWSQNFYDIVNRYENTIVNQFYGHNHHDWFEMFYDNKKFQRPVGFGFVTPAVTARDEGSPVYRIYTVDGNYSGSSWAVLDYTNYFLNLTASNQQKKATWAYSYNPKKDLEMKSLYAADWEDLIQRMEKDDKIFNKFFKYYYNLHVWKQCDDSCKSDIICDLKEGRSYDPDLCTIHK